MIYLDNAATAQRPACVIEREKAFYETENANPMRGFYPLSLAATESHEAARKTVRDFLNAAHTEEIIFTRNTTESLNLVAYSYGLTNLKPGDEIAVSIMEHHSNLLPWQGAYSELYFTDVLWPDFTERDMDAALAEFQRRDRRFGGVK